MTVSYPDTYYAASTEIPPARPPLMGDVKAEIVVIGGGFTGTSAALTLAEAGTRVVLLEAERIGVAASGRNGGQIHTGFRWEQDRLERKYGQERARAFFRLGEEAKALVRERARTHEIKCALTDGLLLAAHSRRAARHLEDEAAHLNSTYDYEARFIGRDEANARTGARIYYGALDDPGGGHLHPLAYVLGIARAAEASGAILYADSHVEQIEATDAGVIARTHQGRVLADRAIVAADAFIETLLPELARYIVPVQSYIVATAPLSARQRHTVLPRNDAVADTRFVLDYYRLSADGRMLFSGAEAFFGDPRVWETRDVASLVRPRMEFVFPQLKGIAIDYAWSGTVGITRTRLPHFGHVNERVSFGYGYSGQGVALANMGGKVLADAAMGKTEAFDLLASMKPKAFPGGASLQAAAGGDDAGGNGAARPPAVTQLTLGLPLRCLRPGRNP